VLPSVNGHGFARRLDVVRRKALSALMLLLTCFFPVPRVEGGQGHAFETLKVALGLSGDRVPLTLALQQLGGAIRGGYVLFGIEVQTVDGKEPTVKLGIEPGTTLGDALRQLLAQVPGYRAEVISDRLVNIYPVAAKGDPSDLLNMRVAGFDVVSQRAGVILSWPERFIPELYQRLAASKTPGSGQHIDLYVGAVAIGPEITLHLSNVTVRQILNAVTEASDANAGVEAPLGWECSYEAKTAAGRGVPNTWRLLTTLPPDWREHVEESKEKVRR
jgi:hypothetical protein